jgi:hypothetical protein
MVFTFWGWMNTTVLSLPGYAAVRVRKGVRRFFVEVTFNAEQTKQED